MNPPSPQDAVQRFVDAMNRGDLEAIVQFYEPDAVLVVQPGLVARGHAELREALAQMLALRPRLSTSASTVLLAGDMALYHGAWTMDGTAPDGSAVRETGRSADVLRRHPDGQWRIVLDNPWGAAVLDAG